MNGRRTFRATYRLQLTPDFGFAAARELIPYLRDLGISHLYLSPSLQARRGSTHGYDVIDPTRISEDLGGEEQFRALALAAQEAGLGLVLDIVPNHMATDDENRFWSDEQLRTKFFDVDPQTGEYRRFFDIDELAGVRQEDEEVFAQTHGKVLSLVEEGLVDALRIDHPDGMADPAGYFERLRSRGVSHVWIEKILEPSERLRGWPVTGTVGYEFSNDVCAVFVDRSSEVGLTDLWQEISGDSRSFHEVALEAKREQAVGTFSREMGRLARLLEDERRAEELAEAAAAMPIYRTYVQPFAGLVTDDDRRAIDETGMAADLAERLLLEREAPAEFVSRFQQSTPPVVAKGVEDTAFYRYCRLLALNDVGGDPGRFGIGVEDFHRGCQERAAHFPQTMLNTVTHDTKRTADVRARIAALSWMSERWGEQVREWLRVTAELRGESGGPDDVERYFLFQTLVGAWPIELDRVQRYMEKSLREAKRNTNWVDQNADWERDVAQFCERLYSHRPFLDSFVGFVDEVAPLAERISLGTVCLKLTAPGVPDIYQGDEMPFRALVDPDNRRPVDWEWNRAMLARLQGGGSPDREMRKLYLTMRLLHLRLRRPDAFSGDYQPLETGGGIIAYTRGDQVLVVVAVRPGEARDELRAVTGTWRDVLRGERLALGTSVDVGELLQERGLAVLERSGTGG
jgi:(1->4)-alpha-D-glucan 1-alpha-D-glucosylmutase